jgi:hypothetical protein
VEGRGGGLGIISANVSTIFGEFHRGILLFFTFFINDVVAAAGRKGILYNNSHTRLVAPFRKRTVS